MISNYQIIYAPMKIYKATSLNKMGDINFDVYALLAVPAYLISEKRIYMSDGTIKYEYEVVFTKDNNDLYKDNYPKYDEYNDCLNKCVVNYISSNEIEMIEYCNSRNNKILLDNIKLSYDKLIKLKDNYENSIIEFYDIIKNKNIKKKIKK
ncbi:MAG TPA: hypothetical protein PLV83_01870 [Bacilli bacterium]|nr:hypothetical protein [Bacilli bacterium]